MKEKESFYSVTMSSRLPELCVYKVSNQSGVPWRKVKGNPQHNIASVVNLDSIASQYLWICFSGSSIPSKTFNGE